MRSDMLTASIAQEVPSLTATWSIVVTVTPKVRWAVQSPDSAMSTTGLSFFIGIGAVTVPGPIPGPAFGDHEFGEAFAIGLAVANFAVIAVITADVADDGALADEVRQSEGGLFVDIDRTAHGATLGRVETVQTDALAVDFDRIAVDDGGRAG